MMALLGQVKDFAIFGNDYDTFDGTAIRDYVHVTDLASAHVQAVKMLAEDHEGGVYNLGTGVGYSVSNSVRDFLGGRTNLAVGLSSTTLRRSASPDSGSFDRAKCSAFQPDLF